MVSFGQTHHHTTGSYGRREAAAVDVERKVTSLKESLFNEPICCLTISIMTVLLFTHANFKLLVKIALYSHQHPHGQWTVMAAGT